MLKPVNQLQRMDPDSWSKETQGELRWVELIQEQHGGRTDKMTCTLNGDTQFVLSVEGQFSITLWFFREDFTSEQALAFLQAESDNFMNRLRAKRAREVAAALAAH